MAFIERLFCTQTVYLGPGCLAFICHSPLRGVVTVDDYCPVSCIQLLHVLSLCNTISVVLLCYKDHAVLLMFRLSSVLVLLFATAARSSQKSGACVEMSGKWWV